MRATASVIIVSRGRPKELSLCLTAVGQLHHPAFEVIVVADEAGRSALADHALSKDIAVIPFDEANISAARNLGLANAAGDVVAFIDDDAVPEPLWLWHLTESFADPDVGAATGYTRGPDGITFQSRAALAHPDGTTHPFEIAGDEPVVIEGDPAFAVKTEGTNMAFRRALLCEMGGFDPALRFYLDETDLDLRLAARGVSVAIVPLAEVHHGTAPGAQRAPAGVPRDLFEVGASLAVFLRRHAPHELDCALARHFAQQRLRLLSAMHDGRLDPRDPGRLLARFNEGVAEGRERALTAFPAIPCDRRPLRPLANFHGSAETLAGRLWAGEDRRARARALAHHAAPVSLFLFSRTIWPHQVKFRQPGYWEQVGGLFGPSGSDQPKVRFWSFKKRFTFEVERLAKRRYCALNSIENQSKSGVLSISH